MSRWTSFGWGIMLISAYWWVEADNPTEIWTATYHMIVGLLCFLWGCVHEPRQPQERENNG